MRIAIFDHAHAGDAISPSASGAWARAGWISFVVIIAALNGLFWVGMVLLVCTLAGLSRPPALLFTVWLVTGCLSTIAVLGIATRPRVRVDASIAPEQAHLTHEVVVALPSSARRLRSRRGTRAQ